MKTIEDLLKNLARSEVLEFGLVTNRLPSINIGGKFEPVDDEAPSTEQVVRMLESVGGKAHIDSLTDKPVQWTTRIDGVGVVAVAAIMRKDVVQARFTVARRESTPSEKRPAASAPPPRSSTPSPAAKPLPPPPASTSSSAQVRAAQPLAAPRLSSGSQKASARGADWDDDDEPTVQTASPPVSAVNAAKSDAAKAAEAAKAAKADPEPARHDTERPKPEIARHTPTSVTALGKATPVEKETRLEPTAKMAEVLALAVAGDASDIHASAGRPVSLRIAGELVPRTQPIGGEQIDGWVDELLAGKARDALERDGACRFLHVDAQGRFRVEIVRQRTGLSIGVRLIAAEPPSVESLGLPPSLVAALSAQQGLILVTGPAGHGKSTTVAALVEHLSRETKRRILVLHELIEHVSMAQRALISYRELGVHVSSRRRAVAAALRADIDVVVLGPLRDSESVRAAVEACEGGRLVIATIDASSAARAVERLVTLLAPPFQVEGRLAFASSFRMAVGLRLLPRADRPARVLAAEVLPASAGIYTLIRDGRLEEIPSLQLRSKTPGATRIEEALAELVKAGTVTADVARAVADFEADPTSARNPPVSGGTPVSGRDEARKA